MTPAEIQILIHFHVSPEKHPFSEMHGVRTDISHLENCGLIEWVSEGIYKTTERGDAHIEQLCGTPWPTQAWIGADGKIIGKRQ